jgi:azurin
VQPDVIVAAYGFGESFKGAAGLPQFEKDLRSFVAGLQAHRFQGKSAAQVVLVSPIAVENLGGALPDGKESNERLRLYTDVMKRVAGECKVGFVDVYEPTREMMAASDKKEPLTFNGIHFTADGYRKFAGLLFKSLVGQTPGDPPPSLTAAVEDKNRQFMLRYRALNTYYIYGDRAKPYGVVNFPDELKKLDEMVANRDQRIWDIAAGKNVTAAVDDSNTEKLPTITGDRPINEWLKPAEELKAFRVDPRFDVNCFASEEDFPDLAKPIQMRFDTRGRLWVSCSTTYPQVYPGQKPNDKIIVLEDTDGDGKADKCTVFADHLHIPLSFEFGDGGVYLSEQPSLAFLKDTDGDGKADVHKILLTGFGTEDSHHALHDFTWSPDGDLIFRESIFLHSNIETPYGVVRTRESSFFRFRPVEDRLTAFGSYYSTNPWGLAFDQWGWHVGSHPVFASAVHALNAPYPEIHISAGDYMPAYSGTCGQEFIYSKQFPDELQGCFVRVRYKPTNEVELQQWVEKDTHYEEKKIGDIWQSTNLSFIPTDVRFGPRGDLYICDWYNPVKGHMQYSLRDSRRDKTSGRIWRITAKGRPLSAAPKIAGAPIPALLDLLKSYEYHTRYEAKTELRDRNPAEVKPALDKWLAGLDPKDPHVLHHQLEALWMYRNIREVNTDLLVKLLRAPDLHVRAAATEQLCFWHPHLPNALDLLRQQANDDSGLVRLQAAIAASWFKSEPAADVAMDLLKHPMDSYTQYALRTALDSLKPYWQPDKSFASSHPQLAGFMTSTDPKARKAAKAKRQKAEPPNPFDKLNPQVVEISTVNERMQYSVTEFKVKAGAPVKLVMENPDATPHNLMIVVPGSEDEIGMAANEMAKLPGAFEKSDFIPKSDKILFATKMLKQNESETLRFMAPKQPGKYPYICSFPGHYLVMKGVMIVE